MINMNEFIDRDIFSCPIFCNEFNLYTFLPLCISCGHTICRSCIEKLTINNTLVCPIDKKKIVLSKNSSVKNQFDNIIILKLLRIVNLSYIDVKALAKFKFSFCEDCENYLSNHVTDIHLMARHKVISFDNYNFKNKDYYLKLSKSEDGLNFDDKEKYKICMFVILDYFHNEKIIQTNSLSAKNEMNVNINEHFYETYFSFVGHKIINEDEICFLSKFILAFPFFSDFYDKNELKNNQKFYFKKGIFINKSNEIIHGIFLTDYGNQLKRAIGVFKDKDYKTNSDAIFFGILILKLNENKYEISLDYGILIRDNHFYFGKFNEKDIYPLFNHVYGEETNLSKISTKRKYSDFVFSQKTQKENIYFCVKYDTLSITKPIRNDLIDHKKTYTVEYHSKLNLNENIDNENINLQIDYLTILYLDKNSELKNEFKINPINIYQGFNILNLSFSESYITFMKPFASMASLKFTNKFSFILSQNFNNRPSYSGYLFELLDVYKNDLNRIPIVEKFFKLSNFPIKNIYENLELFINSVLNFLEESPIYFKINYQDFDSDTDKGIGSYHIINCSEGKIIFNNIEKKNAKEVFFSERLKIFKIYDLFPNINKKEIQEIINSVHSKSTQSKEKLLKFSAMPTNPDLIVGRLNKNNNSQNNKKNVNNCNCEIF